MSLATEVDTDRLADLEETIERGIGTFVEVGAALLEIRDSRMYRESYLTFDDYCRGRWSMSRVHAHRLIEGAEVARLLPMGNTPLNERQARELVPLLGDPEAVIEAWTESMERAQGNVTAAVVRQVVAEATGREEPPTESADWAALRQLMDALAVFTANDAARIAATVPERRRAATAKRLRQLGMYLGRIAWTLEGKGANQ